MFHNMYPFESQSHGIDFSFNEICMEIGIVISKPWQVGQKPMKRHG
jgi:hypothetical protein